MRFETFHCSHLLRIYHFHRCMVWDWLVYPLLMDRWQRASWYTVSGWTEYEMCRRLRDLLFSGSLGFYLTMIKSKIGGPGEEYFVTTAYDELETYWALRRKCLSDVTWRLKPEGKLSKFHFWSIVISVPLWKKRLYSTLLRFLQTKCAEQLHNI